MPTADAKVQIDAPLELVWSVMIDLARYGEWNPFIVRADVRATEVRPGTELLLHVRWPGGGGTTSREIVTRMEAPGGSSRAALEYVFDGLLARTRLVTGSRVQELEQLSSGSTAYHTYEHFHGLLARGVPLKKVQRGFEAHANALKLRAESLARTQSVA
jgi:hypothetical protein